MHHSTALSILLLIFHWITYSSLQRKGLGVERITPLPSPLVHVSLDCIYFTSKKRIRCDIITLTQSRSFLSFLGYYLDELSILIALQDNEIVT